MKVIVDEVSGKVELISMKELTKDLINGHSILKEYLNI